MTAAIFSSRRHSRRACIGVDFHTWDGIFQGSRSHILGLYRQAIVQAPDLDFVFFVADPASLQAAYPEFSQPNVRLVAMPHRPAIWRLGIQLPRLRRQHGIDLLHMQYRLPLFKFGPCAVTIHDVLFETYPQFFPRSFVWQSKLSFRYAARHAELLFSVSRFSQQDIAQHYGVPAKSIHVTYNGVDYQRFHPAGPQQQRDEARLTHLGLQPRQYLLTVGRLEPRKNHLALIHAYAQLGPQAPPLVIVGQRDFSYQQIFERIQALGLETRVRLLEQINDTDLPILLRQARLFIYPAFAEGFGMPVAEALASGVPVITSQSTALPEVVGNAALLVDPYQPADLARTMYRVLQDDTLAQTLVQQGLIQVEQFDWSRSAQVLLTAFRNYLRLASPT